MQFRFDIFAWFESHFYFKKIIVLQSYITISKSAIISECNDRSYLFISQTIFFDPDKIM